MEHLRYSDNELIAFLSSCNSVGAAATLNIGVSQEGYLSKDAIAQLSRMRALL
jgi:hypothetical protein